jgi:hydrogenase nickel incorporation protein HypB
MCRDCGCGLTTVQHEHGHEHTHAHVHQPQGEHLAVLTHLLAQNDETARHNRSHLDEHGVLAINLMSSPGSGKTSLLESTVRRLRDQYRIFVVEGDLATENDARRIRAQGVPALQLNTGNACHLDAAMLHRALHDIRLADLDLMFIENVGNLVCPASFDLGQHRNVVLLSVPEGDDKPEKYPVMFRAADLVLITKTDLLPHLTEFSVQRAEQSLRSIGCSAPVVELSSRNGQGLDAWCSWLEAEWRELEQQFIAHAG